MRCITFICLLFLSFSVMAKGGSRSCETTKTTMRVTFVVERNGGIVKQRDHVIGIALKDLYIRLRYFQNTTIWKKRAKERACFTAALYTTELFTRNKHPVDGNGATTIEHVDRKPDMIAWQRSIACRYAKAGLVAGVKFRKNNKVRILNIRVDTEAKHKGSGYTKKMGVSKSVPKYYCWNPMRTNR